MRKQQESPMKKRVFAALAALSLVFGVVAVAAPANAAIYELANQGAGS